MVAALAAEVEDYNTSVVYHGTQTLVEEPPPVRELSAKERGFTPVAQTGDEVAAEFPVSIYLEDGHESTVRSVRTALQQIAKQVGFDLIEEFDPVYGSFWQRLRAKASDPQNQEALYDRLVKLERSAEVRLLAVPESQANMQNAQGIAALIEALKGESAAVLDLGPLVLVKAPAGNGESTIMCKVLTPKELRMLEAHPELLKDPVGLMAKLTVDGKEGQIEQAQ